MIFFRRRSKSLSSPQLAGFTLGTQRSEVLQEGVSVVPRAGVGAGVFIYAMAGIPPPTVGEIDEIQVCNIEVRPANSTSSPRSDTAIIQRRDSVPVAWVTHLVDSNNYGVEPIGTLRLSCHRMNELRQVQLYPPRELVYTVGDSAAIRKAVTRARGRVDPLVGLTCLQTCAFAAGPAEAAPFEQPAIVRFIPF